MVRSDTSAIPIINWQSIEPFVLEEQMKEVTFLTSFKWTAEAGNVYPELKYEIEKSKVGILKLETDIGIRGSWIPEGTTENWGLMFNRTWQ